MVVHTYNSSYPEQVETGGWQFEDIPGKKVSKTLFQK
jgi:hypothetical protein